MNNLTLKSREKRGPLAWMAGHSVAANLVMAVFLIGGFISLLNVKQELFPDMTFDSVIVTVPYPGASPEDVERGILLSIEEAVRGLDGVDEVTSVANEGSGVVTVDLLLGADVQKLAQDVKSEVDRITTFPDDAEEPRVTVASHKRGVLDLVIYGDIDQRVLHEVAEQIRDQLLQEANITQIDLTGVPDLEISIEIPQENLRRYGLTLEEVAARISASSIDIAGGGLKTEKGEILLRMKERRDYGREFARLPIITTQDGSEIYLEQIATIDDRFADTDRYSIYNGKRAIVLELYRVGDQTPVEVSRAVHNQLEQIVPNLPPGIEIAVERDRSKVYEDRVGILLKNGAIGLVLVLVLLGFFLEVRLAFWVMMGIPISFLGSFLILPAADVTINMMSLFAYIIALGIVVDDAIVVGENIYHYRQEGMGFLPAAIRGVREVAGPVTFSILTNIVAFMPIYFIPGTTGKMFKMVPLVVCIVFSISLVESLFVLPSHLGHQRVRTRRGLFAWLHEQQQAFSRTFAGWVRNGYGPFLDFVLRHRYMTISCAFSILVVMLSLSLSGRMGMGMFPTVESDFSEAQVVLPYGAPVERTEAIMERLEERALRVVEESGRKELITSFTSEIGLGGSHIGRMRINLAEAKIRKNIMSTEEFTNRWRQAVGEIPGVDYMRFASDSGGPRGRGGPITVELSHRDIGVLQSASRELADYISTYPRVKDVDDGFQLGKEQLDFAIKPEGKSLGLNASSVARQVRNAFYGAEAVRQQRGRNEIKVMVRLPEDERSSEETINDLMIRTPAGTFVPLREIAEIERGRSYISINRRNGRRVIQVTADIIPRSKAGEVLDDLESSFMHELQAKHQGLLYSFEGHHAEMGESLASLRVTFLLALLAIYVMLAIPFRSYIQPLIVMVSIPFGIVGAFLGHLIMGYDLYIPSMFGIVALSGVVINDSLVLIDFANRRKREGKVSNRDAIRSAAIQRFRPVMLTTLTTFGGLAPMIFETSRQAKFLIPMALSLGYGILFATTITLLIVPSLFMAIEDIERAWAAVRKLYTVPHKKARSRAVEEQQVTSLTFEPDGETS